MLEIGTICWLSFWSKTSIRILSVVASPQLCTLILMVTEESASAGAIGVKVASCGPRARSGLSGSAMSVIGSPRRMYCRMVLTLMMWLPQSSHSLIFANVVASLRIWTVSTKTDGKRFLSSTSSWKTYPHPEVPQKAIAPLFSAVRKCSPKLVISGFANLAVWQVILVTNGYLF